MKSCKVNFISSQWIVVMLASLVIWAADKFVTDAFAGRQQSKGCKQFCVYPDRPMQEGCIPRDGDISCLSCYTLKDC